MLDEDTFTKLWKLTNDWAAQQKTNHELASGLNKQLAEQKQTAESKQELLQTSASSLLLSSDAKDLDQATAELLANYKELSERHNAVMERNQALHHECNDLQDIVKSYEENIKVITDKLRSHTVSAAEGHVQLRREYEALLDAEKGTTAELLLENMTLRHQLHHLAAKIRKAYADQEDMDHTSTTKLAELEAENRALREMLQLTPSSSMPAPPDTIQPIHNQTSAQQLRPTMNSNSSSSSSSSSSSGVVEEYFEE
ncbi:predicted protein [Lichtheimia corymbifera JMRC:FSU:9682]|uniref:Autophagy-related protein 16 domain-containing protein n=1 Tax=Lichtheimia corymbifera JMRC:FSU:9682 TaxID=1263082 RepID=A0A068SCH5_9FUNG|nr:predicted protein [Lichtheimia corymbifera JMRC:FSU:9682]